MKLQSLVLGALLVSGAALAQTVIETVVVRGSQDPDVKQMSFACADLQKPSPSEVEGLFKIADKAQTPRVATDLMRAVGDACGRGIPHIVVERSPKTNKVRWFAAEPGVIVETPVYYIIE